MQNDMEWFLVVTATRARILRSLSKPGEAAEPELVMRAPGERLRAMMAGSPEHRPASRRLPAGRRHAHPLQDDERVFIGQVVALLESHRMAGDFIRLHIFAAQHILDLMQQEAPATLRARIAHEFTLNLAGFSERKLPDRIRQVLSENCPEDRAHPPMGSADTDGNV